MPIKFLKFYEVVHAEWDRAEYFRSGITKLDCTILNVKDKLPFVLIAAPSNQQQLEFLEKNMPDYMKIIFKSRPAINTVHKERPFASNTVLVLDHA